MPKGELRQKGRCLIHGVLCVVPGKSGVGRFNVISLHWKKGVNLLPGFSPELQGVYSETDADGMKRLYGYVLK